MDIKLYMNKLNYLFDPHDNGSKKKNVEQQNIR